MLQIITQKVIIVNINILTIHSMGFFNLIFILVHTKYSKHMNPIILTYRLVLSISYFELFMIFRCHLAYQVIKVTMQFIYLLILLFRRFITPFSSFIIIHQLSKSFLQDQNKRVNMKPYIEAFISVTNMYDELTFANNKANDAIS